MSTPSTAPIRLALIITELEVGGAEKCLVELAARLDRRRFAPVVYVLGPPPSRQTLVSQLATAGVEVHFLDGRSFFDAPRVTRTLADLLRVQRPQVVQTFLFHANLLGRLAARQANVQRVASAIRVAERGRRWHLWLDRWTSRWVDKYVCVSESVAQFSRQEAGLPLEKLLVIPNGIDLEEFDASRPAERESLGLPPDRRLVTYVGRFDLQKGLPELLDLSPRWMNELTDHDLLLVGGYGHGKEEVVRRDLCDRAGRLGIAERVHIVGWQDNVPGILRISDMLVLPSRWEGMPNVMLEAMAAGLPVVAYAVEGTHELLGQHAGEQLVSASDASTFAERVVALGKNRELAARLGIANRARVEKEFTLALMIKSYERFYEAVSGV